LKDYTITPNMSSNNIIALDATNWKSKEDFYTSYCNATTAPKWFGRNLDALADSFRGGICRITPEKIVVRNLTSKIKDNLGLEFWRTVEEICQEEEVELEVHND
jgi:RNAse (barnase) inhibitor barstar